MASALLTLSRLAAPSAHHGTPIAESREALGYWSRRASELPWHRRAARREARSMAHAARTQLIRAHLDRWHLGAVVRTFGPLIETHGRSAGGHARALAFMTMRRTAIGRRILFAVAGIAAAAVACTAVAAVVVTQLVSF